MNQSNLSSFRSPVHRKPQVVIDNYELSVGRKRHIPLRPKLKLSARFLFISVTVFILSIQYIHPILFNKNKKRNIKKGKTSDYYYIPGDDEILEVVENKSDSNILKKLQKNDSFSKHQQPLTPINTTSGVALVSACQTGHENIVKLLPLWLNLYPNVTQVILVDWSSNPLFSMVVEELDRQPEPYSHVTILRVANQESLWSVSMAFNIAFRYASAPNILALPSCDQRSLVTVHSSFFIQHPLSTSVFYTGDRRLERSEDEQPFDTILYIRRALLLSVGGYDERLATPLESIREDHHDLIGRLIERNLKREDINYDTISIISTSRPFDDVSKYERVISMIGADVNMKLLATLPVWNATGSDLAFKKDVSTRHIVPSYRHHRIHYVSININRVHSSVRDSVHESLVATTKKSAITDFLQREHGVPACLTRILPLTQRLSLLQSFMNIPSNKARQSLFVLVLGDLPGRLMLLASARSFAEKTGRPLFLLWPRINGVPDLFTSANVLFHDAYTTDPSMIVIENINEEMLMDPDNDKSCPTSGQISNNTHIYGFYDGQKVNKPIPVNVSEVGHFIIHGNSHIESDTVRLSNLKTIREELRKIPMHDDIAARLRSLNERELSISIGIHVPQIITTTAESQNHTDTLRHFAAVHSKMAVTTSRFKNTFNTSSPVYIDGDSSFVRKFKHLGLTRMLPTLKITDECEMRGRSKCFVAEFIQIMVLTRTIQFYSPVNDTFSRLIQLYRNDGNNY